MDLEFLIACILRSLKNKGHKTTAEFAWTQMHEQSFDCLQIGFKKPKQTKQTLFFSSDIRFHQTGAEVQPKHLLDLRTSSHMINHFVT